MHLFAVTSLKIRALIGSTRAAFEFPCDRNLYGAEGIVRIRLVGDYLPAKIEPKKEV